MAAGSLPEKNNNSLVVKSILVQAMFLKKKIYTIEIKQIQS